ncbi:MAG: alpha/beta hydrolase [Planctomycetota bacterium]|nr:alpha/beta hydrolase [Planctomycetota bacterium]
MANLLSMECRDRGDKLILDGLGDETESNAIGNCRFARVWPIHALETFSIPRVTTALIEISFNQSLCKTVMRKTVQNRNVLLQTEYFGEKNGIPLLLIAGAMAPASSWPDFFCLSLSKQGFLVIRFDHRDFGESTHFEPCRPDSGLQCPYTMNDLVEDCVCILDDYAIEKCHVAGHSMGGSIAQLLAVFEPERILSAIAISAPLLAIGCPGLKEPSPEIQKRTWDIFLQNPMHADAVRGIPEFMKIWRYLNGSLPLDEKMAHAYTLKIYETQLIEPAWNHIAVQDGIPDLYPELIKSRIPLLFIQGEEDCLVQNAENIDTLARYLGQVSCQILNKAGHVFFNKGVWLEIEDHVKAHINANTLRTHAPDDQSTSLPSRRGIREGNLGPSPV